MTFHLETHMQKSIFTYYPDRIFVFVGFFKNHSYSQTPP